MLEALKAGAIDLYPEYTGTIAREILKLEERLDLAEIEPAAARRWACGVGVPLGFNNSYALAMRGARTPSSLGIRTLSDLPKHPALRFGLSHEFLGRADGWPGLQARLRPAAARRAASTTASPTRRSPRARST